MANAPEPNEILPDLPIQDFSGGLRTDKANSQLKDNELAFVNGVEFYPGRMQKRAGSQIFGGWDSGGRVGTFTTGVYGTFGGGHNQFVIANQETAGNGGQIYRLATTTLITTCNVGDTTLSLVNDALDHEFDTSGTVEIEGDIITYSSKSGSPTNTLNGVTGISASHPAGASVKQWVRGYGAAQDCSGGVYFSFLNNLLIISRPTAGQMESWGGVPNINANTITIPSGSNGLRFLTTYKQRVYGVGIDNTTKLAQSTIYFSAINDGTSWTSTDNFSVEDANGDSVTAQYVYRGHLMIFKRSSTWYFNLSVLTQSDTQVGAWNNQCVQEINGILYVFGPKGVYHTVGRYLLLQNISQPVKKWLDAFSDSATTGGTSISGVFPSIGREGNKLKIFLGNIVYDQLAYNNVTLVYDTLYGYWTVLVGGMVGVTGMLSVQNYLDNSHATDGSPSIVSQPMLFYFGGQNTTGVYQVNNNYSTGLVGSTPVLRGGTFNQDEFVDTAGRKIAAEAWTKLFFQGNPGWWKKFGYLRVYAERWPFDVEARTINDAGYTDWEPLGQSKGWHSLFPINLEGYAVQFRIMENSKNDPFIETSIIIERTTLVGRNRR